MKQTLIIVLTFKVMKVKKQQPDVNVQLSTTNTIVLEIPRMN